MKERELSSTVGDIETLWAALDKVRSTSKSVTVPKALLSAVLLDHTRMSAALFSQRHRRNPKG